MQSSLKQLLTRIILHGPDKHRKILFGPCRGFRLPRAVAKDNLAMLLGIYELQNQRILRKLARGCTTAYDIGSHVGFFSLLLRKAITAEGMVVAFEPSTMEFNALKSIIQANNLESSITALDIAVSETTGFASFISGGSSTTGILAMAPEAQGKRSDDLCQVRTETLDNLVYRRELPPPDLIKIDVESAEALVIKGALKVLREFKPKLFVELHGPSASTETIALLLELDYKISFLGSEGPREVTTPEQLVPEFRSGKWTQHIVAK